MTYPARGPVAGLTEAVRGPAPVLFLAPATGGGHRAAAAAIAETLQRRYPGTFAPVICDPLSGPGCARPLRWITRGYGPLIRHAPWLWGLLYRATDSRPAATLLHRAVGRLARRAAVAAITASRPALIVSCHPLTGHVAIQARDAAAPAASVITTITDLGRAHATWSWPKADRVVAASGAGAPSPDTAAFGVPVGARFLAEPPETATRAALRQRLGHPDAAFLVLLTGGAEGAGRMARQSSAIVRGLPDVDVAVICGRNGRLRRRLERLAARSRRLSVHGFVPDMADWLRAADVVVTKAGPSTIAEAACCGTAMLLSCQLPGQEEGNVGYVTGAGAGLYLPRVSQLVAAIARLRDDAAELAAMRAASARLARQDAAGEVAGELAAVLAGPADGSWRQ